MLQLTIPAKELWDEVNEEFITTKEQTLQLEHSLVSLSKWEAKWQKPFLSKDTKTFEETVDYVRCMTITQNVNPDVYNYMSDEDIERVNRYIESPMTATWFNENRHDRMNREQITSEIIYYWMISLNIPFECQKWHLNRLLTLVRVCNIKNQPSKKMSRKEAMNQHNALKAARRKSRSAKG